MTNDFIENETGSSHTWKLFERFGVELEYMICDKKTLNVLPITDKVLYELSGAYLNEVALENGISCSNELALHVFEFKTETPVEKLDDDLAWRFHNEIQKINRLLQKWDVVLLPSGMHPWMNPMTELKLWTHEYNPIYEAYNRIFHCQGHGWANLQSTHLNISFSTDEELKALHSAIRWLLPIIPALSASSPFMEGRVSGFIDTRLQVYQYNQKNIPSITGHIVPEPISSKAEYFEKILKPMWRDIAPYDPENLLQEEWLNSRGAIARFERMAIEIRIIDIQEHPLADIAILRAVVTLLKRLAQKVLDGTEYFKKIETTKLKEILLDCVERGSKAVISDKEYLSLFSLSSPMKACDIWKTILGEKYLQNDPILLEILDKGTLSERMLKMYSQTGSLKHICQSLADSLQNAELFQERVEPSESRKFAKEGASL